MKNIKNRIPVRGSGRTPMKTKIIRSLFFFFSFMMALQFCILCFASEETENKKVKVAYFDFGDYYIEENGIVKSYDRDYLNKVEEYSDLEFEYVDCGTWNNALAMLNNKEVDLVGTGQWTAEREELYEFCLENYGFTMTTLVALHDSDIIYEDYEAIGKAVVGYTKNYVRRPEVDAFFEEHNISPEIKTYENQMELENALLSGEIDIMAASSHALLDDWKIIERLNYAPFFWISQKGNTVLTDAIDEASAQIAVYEKSFLNDLMRKWFAELVSIPLTKEEIDYINNQEELTIYFDDNTKPLSWRGTDGEMLGLNKDVCNLISERTGLKFEYGFIQDTDAETLKSDNAVINFTMINVDGVNKNAASGQTKAVMTDNFSLYHIAGEPYETEGQYTVAIPANHIAVQEYLKTQYPTYQIVEYAAPMECIEALDDGKVDLVFLSNSVVNTLIIENNFSNCIVIPTTSHEIGIALQFHGDHAEIFADIVDKGLTTIRKEERNEIELKYALETVPKATLSYFVSQNMVLSGVVIAIAIAVFLIIAVTFTRSRAIKRESQRVKAANDSKSDFFARMSHDMRTPMNGILGLAELAKNENDFEVVRQDLDKIYYSGKYMLGLINDTLDIQRLESGKMVLEPTIVPSKILFDDILAFIQPSMKEKNQNFEVILTSDDNNGMDRYIRIDTLRFKQIVTNILSNAMKYTPSGGNIRLELKELGREGLISHSLITISDNGVGMSEAFIENRLFDPYSQEHNAMSDHYAGSGLGLSIVKKLVDLMGGRIEAESELGKGTTFRIYLDVEIVPNEEVEKIRQSRKKDKKSSTSVIGGKRVLLCEDHPLNAEITKRLLEKLQCEVEWAENGAIGLELFEKSEPGYYDAILMDIRMPVMDGLKATEMIRASGHPDAKVIPMIAMSANAYEEDIAASLKAGMNAHLAKPVEPQKMFRVLADYLKEKK
ncbi:MAG: transporter substrate-binding domain-containing protein [Paludibacter sp.]|nr:transporter substrate-binding domain-containing protein [Paludibacter sp.]